MSADIVQFIPRPNPNRRIETMAADILNDDAFRQAIDDMNHIAGAVIKSAVADNFIVPGILNRGEDTAPCEYLAPDKDSA